jgi:hypothetical protein
MIAGVSSPIETPDSMLRSTKKDSKGRHCSATPNLVQPTQVRAPLKISLILQR